MGVVIGLDQNRAEQSSKGGTEERMGGVEGERRKREGSEGEISTLLAITTHAIKQKQKSNEKKKRDYRRVPLVPLCTGTLYSS